MSLLDDVSIVVTPNGYKAGELYAVVPVPTYGAELVTDGDFPLGTTAWSTDTGWSVGGGVASSDGTNSAKLYQNVGVAASKSYEYIIEVKTLTSGTISLYYHNGSYQTIALNLGLGTHNLRFNTSGTPNGSIYVNSNSFIGSVDNISVKEITSADMDVTRETAATRVDENGLVNYAEVIGGEEVTNGDFATDLSGWSNKSSTSTWVSGSARIDNSIGNANSGLYQDIGLVLGKTYTLTATLKLISGDSNGDFKVFSSEFNGSGQTSLYQGETLIIGGSSVTETIEFTHSNSDVSIQFACDTTNAIFEIDNVSVKELTRDNVPRIDYTGGGCPHILAEPQRTNLLPYSEDFSQWGDGNVVIESGYSSPDGENNAYKITNGATDGLIYLSGYSNTNDARSIYARTVSGTGTAQLLSHNANTNNTFTLTEEWQRFEVNQTSNVVTVFYGVDFRGSGTLEEVLIWGAQTEVGSYPTSLIPTNGEAGGVTRNQDIFSRDGIGSLINSTEGVLFVEMAALSDDETNREITLSDGTGSNYVLIRFNSGGSNRIYTRVDVGGALEYYDLNTSHTITNNNKIAIRWGASNFATFINGVEAGSQLSGSSFSADTLNNLSFDNGAGGGNFYGKVKQLQVYDTSLSDTQLAALTS